MFKLKGGGGAKGFLKNVKKKNCTFLSRRLPLFDLLNLPRSTLGRCPLTSPRKRLIYYQTTYNQNHLIICIIIMATFIYHDYGNPGRKKAGASQRLSDCHSGCSCLLLPNNHITFNVSQIFEIHPSTSLLKCLLTPIAAIASFQLIPKYMSEVKVNSKYFRCLPETQ